MIFVILDGEGNFIKEGLSMKRMFLASGIVVCMTCSAFATDPTGFDLSTLDAGINGTTYGFIRGNGNASYGNYSPTPYDLTESGTWGTTFDYGKVRGEALCSSTSGTYAQPGTPDENITGRYCWCKVTGYQASGGSEWQNVSSVSWVFGFDHEIADFCPDGCAFYCANYVQNDSVFRNSMFGVSQ